MRKIRIGDVSITSIVERDGPWRAPSAMFPTWDATVGQHHLAGMPPYVYDAASDRMVITYQTFVVRTPHHTIFVDTCTGEDKAYGPPMDFPKQPWLDAFRAQGLRFGDITHVFCTHLHIDHSGWNTRLENGRWTPTFPNATYIFHKREYAFWEAAHARGEERPGMPAGVFRMNCEAVVDAGQALLVDDDYALDDTVTLTPTPGHSPCHCCVNISSRGQKAVVTGDLFHHPLQVREPDWATIFDYDAGEGTRSRRRFFADVADTPTVLLPVHFPAPTAGRIEHQADGYHYRFNEA